MTAEASSRVHVWLAARSPWQRRGLALLAGALATLGHAPFQLTLVYAIALVALVWLLDAASTRPKRFGAAAGTGFFFGLGHFSTGLYWISSAFMVDAVAWGPVWGIPAVLGLATLMAVFWALGCALAMTLWTRDIKRIPWFAACLFATEWLRGNLLFGGFPWLLPGYVWTPGEPVSQLASVVGIYGLSLLTLLLGAAPAAVADGGQSAGRRFAPMLVAALVIGMSWGWGVQRISRAPVEPPGARAVVRVADSGLSQAEKWCEYPTEEQVERCVPNQEWRVLQRYLEASGAAEESRAQVLIWPEGAIPVVNFYMLENQEFLDALGRGLGDRALITGLTRRALEGDTIVHFNSAAVIDGVTGQARVSEQIYDKHRLVPGGEYIPFWSLISQLNIAPLQRIGAGFEPGERPTRLVVPEAPMAVVLICYEAIFPGMAPRGEERPGWIVSVTNDAWFGEGTGPWQHYAMARYRAIEEGLPLARAASGGVSAIVDSYGRAVRETRRGVLFAEAQIPPSLEETLFARYGHILLLLLLVIVISLRLLPLRGAARGQHA